MGLSDPSARNVIWAEQPHRIVQPRRRPTTWPYDEHPEIESPGRAFPCGHTDGGFLAGPSAECRAADVLIEDVAGPPLYCGYGKQAGRCIVVESTHTETTVKHRLNGGLEAMHHRIPHPRGLCYA